VLGARGVGARGTAGIGRHRDAAGQQRERRGRDGK
jgi:hypothetical protein